MRICLLGLSALVLCVMSTPVNAEPQSPRFVKLEQKGLVFNFQLGVGIPVAQEALNLPLGVRYGVDVGYKIPLRKFTITPLLHVARSEWGTVDSFAVQAGARLAYTLKPGKRSLKLWWRSMVGYGQVRSLYSAGSFTMNHGVGVSMRINRYFGVGVIADFGSFTLDPTLLVDKRLLTVELGLVLNGKIPL